MAGLGYLWTVKTRCSTPKEMQNQNRVAHTILTCKGCNKQQIKRMDKFKTGNQKENKRFLSKGTIITQNQRGMYTSSKYLKNVRLAKGNITNPCRFSRFREENLNK